MSNRGELFGDTDDFGLDDSAEDGLSEDPKTPKSPDKRISELQSRADKETARANKAEARLKALQETMQAPDPDVRNPVSGDAASDAILDMARIFAVQQNPKLAEYGLSASDLSGSTPSEVARAAAELVARFEKIETQARNKVLAQNGLSPEVDAGTPPPPTRDYSAMSKEDFDKVLAGVRR